MAEPFNYNIDSPTEAFQKAYAFGDALGQRQAQQQRSQQVQDALQSIATDRSPQNIAQKLLMFPELKEQIATSESVLGEAERSAANGLRAEVISLFKAGNPTAARQRLETQAQAYANTPGKEREAQAAQALLKSFDINPDAVILPMTIQLAQSDDKLYDNLFKKTEPYVIVPGVGVVLKSDIERAADEAERNGSPTANIAPIIPADAEAELKAGRVSTQAFDSVFGVGSAAKIMGMGSSQPTSASKTITERDAARMRANLGPKGFMEWMRTNNIAIVGK